MTEKKSYIYIKDPEFAWIPATLEKSEGDKAYVSVPQYKDEQSISSDGGRRATSTAEDVISLKDYPHKVLPLQNVDANGNLLVFSDMVKLPYLHEAGILYNMKARHMEGHPYTRTGDIVIAINPFQWFTHLYTEEKCQYYSNRLVWVDSDNDPRDGMEPHVYEVSALSYKGLAFGGLDQSILVSGESGAGKTETVKIAMSHMASVQKGPGKKGGSQELDPVVKRVVESNPLLEAFGNAKTRRNDNSSRFGKYLQLQFDNSEAHLMGFGDKTESKCKLAGSKCDVYLLEKNRVVGHDSEGERTYHIFYQLLAAPEDEKAKIWSKLKGQNTSSYKYIGHNECNTIEGMSDAQHWQKTRDTLELIDVKGEKLVGMMRAIAAVMLLGNVEFEKKGGDADKSAVKTKDAIHDLAGLMHVDEEQLSLSFTERTMKTKTEEYKVPLKPDAAKDACDALAKEIYGKVFLWLVRAINAATCAEDNYKDGSMSKFGIIGLLDIFGFESFVVNRFEQLCINYANEKLQQKFTEDIFRSVQEEYESEGIELAEIWYDDNTDVLDLIEGRTGLLALLNEECVRPKGNDEQFVQKALQMNGKSPCMITNKMDRMSFGIHHYAGKVMYDADQFVSRNQDTLPIDLGDLCKLSDNYVISAKIDEMADMEAPSNSRAPRRAKSNLIAPTVWGKYKTQLASLMGNLRKTNSRYIRCIKPNMAKKPVLMEHVPTVEQLRCAGVVAAVTLSRSAFPNRLENQVTRYRYGSQWDGAKYPSKRRPGMTPEEMLSADCDAILECALKEKEIRDGDKVIRMFVVGKTRSYFRAGALEYLEANRLENGLDEPATQIQKIGRGWLLRRKLNDLTSGAREAERLRLEEEERKKMAELELKAAADREAKLELERRKKAEAIRKAKAEQEAKEKAERLELKKREREERERIEAEEESAREKVKNMKKEIRKLEKKLDDFKVAAERKIRDAEEEAEELEQEQVELKKKYEEIMKAAASVDKGEINANKKKIEESEMIVTYLRKENKKTRDKTDKMKEDLQDLKEQNNRLIEANASAGASLDSLEKQKVNLQSHNTKLEENLKKYKTQNNQLKADLDNRNAYLKAEAKIKDEYQRALEQIIELMENRCDDGKLVEDVTAAQLQCEAIATHKVGQLSHLDL